MRFAISLLGLLLLAPASASAATPTVQVGSDFFDPTSVSIAKGDGVHWDWVDGINEHTVTARRRQTDRFGSSIQRGGNEVFDHNFRFPGRFRYFCKIHPFTMTGVVRVGTPETVDPRIRHARFSDGKVRFRLSERSVVKLTLKRGSRTVKRVSKVFGSGRHAVRLGSLRDGSYTAALQATDGWGNRSETVKVRFSIG